jgi:hypothetical protein
LFTQEEYPFGDDASDDDEVVGMATTAIAKPTSSSSLFASATNQSAPTTMRLVSRSRYKGITSSHTHHT